MIIERIVYTKCDNTLLSRMTTYYTKDSIAQELKKVVDFAAEQGNTAQVLANNEAFGIARVDDKLSVDIYLISNTENNCGSPLFCITDEFNFICHSCFLYC